MNNSYRRPGFFGGFSLFPPVIKILLLLNVTIYVLFNLLLYSFQVGSTSIELLVTKYFALNPLEPIIFRESSGQMIQLSFYPWQLFTYMFLHGGFFHLLLNMFALWMFGVELENIWGQKRFLTFYLICGLGAGLCNLFIAPLFGPVGPTVGASGAIYGILVAFGYLFPDRNIYIYGLIPVKAKYLVIFYMLIELFAVAGSSDSGIAHMAHLGGGVVGLIYLLIFYKGRGMNFFNNPGFKSRFSSYNSSFSGKKPSSIFSDGSGKQESKKENIKDADFQEIEVTDYKKQMETQELQTEERLNTLLDKVSATGYQSLTEDERAELSQLSRKIRY